MKLDIVLYLVLGLLSMSIWGVWVFVLGGLFIAVGLLLLMMGGFTVLSMTT